MVGETPGKGKQVTARWVGYTMGSARVLKPERPKFETPIL
jgi:hypothetical protein